MITYTEVSQGTEIKIQYEGNPNPGWTADTLNFTGSGVTASDAGSGQINVNVPGYLGAFTAKFIPSTSLPSTQTTNTRAISNGYLLDAVTTTPGTWTLENSYGTLATAFNTLNGQFTVSDTAIYNLSVSCVINAAFDAPNDLISTSNPSNPNGFMNNSGINTPNNTFTSPGVLDFDDYVGEFRLAITDERTTPSQTIYASNSQFVYYNTSQIVISASYIGRRINPSNILSVKYLNRCKQHINVYKDLVTGESNCYFLFSAVQLINL